jgi:AcrR family transcriptional regulator
MRKLAAQLGVEAMSIYHHLPNRQAILGAVADRVLGQVPIPEGELGWRARTERFAGDTYQVLMAHPAVVTILATEEADPSDPRALAASNATIGALADAGFSPVEQVTIYHAITSIIFGFVLSHTRGLTQPWGYGEGKWTGDVEAVKERTTEIPHIAALIPIFLTAPQGDDFRLTVRLFLDGIEREHTREEDETWQSPQ